MSYYEEPYHRHSSLVHASRTGHTTLCGRRMRSFAAGGNDGWLEQPAAWSDPAKYGVVRCPECEAAHGR